jgi:glyoxylase-like metal-dependent hydrolase (beta-lactamase superfamily II)
VLIERLVAPNPGPMTLTGTNTYLVTDASGHVAIVDPGPDEPAHLSAILSAARTRGEIKTIIVTHHHIDHLPAAAPLCRQTGALLAGHLDLPGVERPLRDGDAAFGTLVALATPGHTRDSICLWSAADGSLFTGDLVLGMGSAVLDDTPGALSDYLASLERLKALRPRTIYPGHGPIVEDAISKLTEYLQHRQQRLRQVVDALAARGPSTADELAAAIYIDVPAHLLPMAARNVRANLDSLLAQQRVSRLSDDRWQLTP